LDEINSLTIQCDGLGIQKGQDFSIVWKKEGRIKLLLWWMLLPAGPYKRVFIVTVLTGGSGYEAYD